MEAYKLAVVYRAYQEGLHDTAKERHASNARRSTPARLAGLKTALHVASFLAARADAARARCAAGALRTVLGV